MFAKLHRRQFVSGRVPLSDAEFALRLGVRPELHRFMAAARESLARVCRVPASSLHPDDAPESLLKLLTCDWDDVGLIMELEQILGIPIEDEIPHFLGRRFFWSGETGPQTIGEWSVRVAEHLQSRQSQTQAANRVA